MYIYVANETNDDVNVFFDNLTIAHTGLKVVEHTDYYPYGMVMRKEIPDQGQGIYNPYRFGYQGQFAEKDEETGWNHFELREYGSRIGRWTATDPYRQFYSPYNGMGNNPINSIDRDGGWRNLQRAERLRQKAIDMGLDPGELYKVGKHYGFNLIPEDGVGINFAHKFFGATNHTLWFRGAIEANGRGVSGTLEWWINYGDLGSEMSESWQARSGSSNINGIESGFFTADNFHFRDGRTNADGVWNTANLGMTRDGVGFSLNINGSSDSKHRIHPDGESSGNWQINNGTAGCIGLQCGSTDLKLFENMAQTHLSTHSSIRLIVTGGH